jgi:2-polyprenyl-3-methyl-5-hydroxy-6-metoxy-1,4-benzoquinol methylase
VLDVGFGRCEWLGILKEQGIAAYGVDCDEDLVRRALEKGFTAHLGDAIEYLSKLPANSLSGITAFHVVEHLPFDVLKQFLYQCHRTLASGGVLIFETPNPENLVVASHDFWMDPTHIKPIPATVLEFWTKAFGISQIQIVKKSPYNLISVSDANDPGFKDMAYRFNLERDYALLGQKE